MVIDRRFDTEGSIVDAEEGPMEEDIYLGDEFVESGEAMNRMEARENAPQSMVAAGPTQIPWQALRLPGARTGERGVSARVRDTLSSLFTRWQTNDVRTSPYLYLVTANTWTQYINNMDAQDVGAELSAPISMEERSSLFLFAEEWRTDISHQRFRTRLMDNSSVNMSDEISKGQLIYDVVTGVVQPIARVSGAQTNVMFRLAMDILQSIRMRYYNFYSVNLLHRDEGSAIYEEFLSRYIPLEAHEVAIITEISTGVAARGRRYAADTTSPVTDAVQNFALMNRAVDSYHMGDTRTTRAAIALLLGAPISYKTVAGFSVNTDPLGRSYLTTSGNLIAVRLRIGSTQAKEQKKATTLTYLIRTGKAANGSEVTMTDAMKSSDQTLNFGANNVLNGAHFIEVEGMNNANPTHYWRFSPDGKQAERLDYAATSATMASLPAMASSGQEQSAQHQRGRQRSVRRPNPPNDSLPNPLYLDGRDHWQATIEQGTLVRSLHSVIANADSAHSAAQEIVDAWRPDNIWRPLELQWPDRDYDLAAVLIEAYRRLIRYTPEHTEKGRKTLELVHKFRPNFSMNAKDIPEFLALNREITEGHDSLPNPPIWGTKETDDPKVLHALIEVNNFIETHIWPTLYSIGWPVIPKEEIVISILPHQFKEMEWITNEYKDIIKPRTEHRITNEEFWKEMLEENLANWEGQNRTSSSRVVKVIYDREDPKVIIPAKGPHQNPVRVGQGQHFFIELIPKSKMSFTAKDKKHGSPKGARSGKGRGPKNAIVGTPTQNDPTGFGDIFGGFQEAGYVAWKGTHKATGKSLPWMIQLPRKKGKTGRITFKAAQVTKNGRTYKSIRPFTANKQIKAAWKKFTDYYGEPVFAQDGGFKTKFIIEEDDRGPFYKRLKK